VDGLKVFDLQTLQIALGCFDARVPQDLREVEEIPASTEIIHRERVSTMPRSA